MERTRLKLAVIFLLAALNVVLLGYVLLQAQQSKDYEDLTRQQIMTYLTDHGIAVSETRIAVGLSDLGVSSATIQSIETGYRYAGEGDRGVLTPMWKLETSGQSYYLNCATGEVTLPTE